MPQRLPLFPLGTVLVPGEVLPLHVFEQRYLDLVRDLLGTEPDAPVGPGARFGVVAIRSGSEVGEDRLPAMYDVGCTAQLLQVDRGDDLTIDLVTVGRERFRLIAVDEDAGTSYLTGLVDWLDEPVATPEPDLVELVRTEFADYCRRLGLGIDATAPEASPALADPTTFSYVVTATLAVNLSERQGLLAAHDATARLRACADLLRRERLLWRLGPNVPAVDLARIPPDPR